MWQKTDTNFHFRDPSAPIGGPAAPIVDEDAGNVTLSGPQKGEIGPRKRAA